MFKPSRRPAGWRVLRRTALSAPATVAITTSTWSLAVGVQEGTQSVQLSDVTADRPNDAWAIGSARAENQAIFEPVVKRWCPDPLGRQPLEHGAAAIGAVQLGRAGQRLRPSGRGTGDYFVAVFGTSGVSFGAGRRLILEPSQTSGSYLRPTTRSFIGISALSVILMCSGQTSVQHLVMLQ